MRMLERTTRPLLSIGLICALVLLPLESWAKKVFLNGVEITGMSGRTFKDVSVKLGANGNVYIIGKQYKVVSPKQARNMQKAGSQYKPTNPTAQRTPAVRSTTGAATGGSLNKNYLLVVQRTAVGASGYRLVIQVNGVKVKEIKLSMIQDVIPLNRYLKTGRNTLVIESYKEKTKASGGISVIMSTGKIKGGRVFVNQPYLMQYNRLSSEQKNYRHIFPINIK